MIDRVAHLGDARKQAVAKKWHRFGPLG